MKVSRLDDFRRARHTIQNERSASIESLVMGEPVIEVRGLHKSYGTLEAVRGIDLEVARREVFAFLGPNGAGKTTTVEILEGYRRRDAGEIAVLGVDPASAGAPLAPANRDRAPGMQHAAGAHRSRVAGALRRLLRAAPLGRRDDRARGA